MWWLRLTYALWSAYFWARASYFSVSSTYLIIFSIASLLSFALSTVTHFCTQISPLFKSSTFGVRNHLRSHLVRVRLPNTLSLVEVSVTVVVRGFGFSILIRVDYLPSVLSSSYSATEGPSLSSSPFLSLRRSSSNYYPYLLLLYWNSLKIALDSSSWSLC